MTDIIESGRLMELVIDKHSRFLESFGSEFKELENRLNTAKKESDAIKKEAEAAETRITVLNEKYHLLFHVAKKLREELFNSALEKMRGNSASIQDIMRISGRIEEHEKKLQNSKNIEDEEKTIVEIKKFLYDFESLAKKAGITVTCKGVMDKLDEANFSHKELLSLQHKPKPDANIRDNDKQAGEIDNRCEWLKRRIESHNKAIAYWVKQKGDRVG